MSDEAVWAAILDAFEARLDAQRDALALGAPGAIVPFVAPAVATPLPDSQLDRAATLVRRCRDLEDELTAALNETGASLSRVVEAPAPTSAQPVYFDNRV